MVEHNCSFCDYKTGKRSNLTRHRKTKHAVSFTPQVCELVGVAPDEMSPKPAFPREISPNVQRLAPHPTFKPGNTHAFLCQPFPTPASPRLGHYSELESEIHDLRNQFCLLRQQLSTLQDMETTLLYMDQKLASLNIRVHKPRS